MSEVIVIKPDRPARHECALPLATYELDGAVARCPHCGEWSVCVSGYVEHYGPVIKWRAIRPWDHRAKALIRNYRKDTP
jgi:hypothetical protein